MESEIELRLKIYEKALKDYEEAAKDVQGSTWEEKYIYAGFCKYFFEIHRIDVHNEKMVDKLPELFAQRPLYFYSGDFWDTLGPTEKRIQWLKNAIELCKTTN